MAIISKINHSHLVVGLRIDAEFYQPEYLELENKLSSLSFLRIRQFSKVTDGEHGSVVLRTSGIKYLTAENVKKGYVDTSKVRYVDQYVDKKNARARVRVGDVLVSIKGTLGEIAIAERWLLPANMNRDVAIIKPFRTDKILNECLAVFLMSKYGAFQSKRGGSGGVQQMITLERLREFKIPILPVLIQQQIRNKYVSFLKKKQDAEVHLNHAIQLLEITVGLNNGFKSKEKVFIAKFSETISSKRFDSEYYQPEFKKLKEAIYSYEYGWEPLLLHVQSLKPFFSPWSYPNKQFKYVELSSISATNGLINGPTILKGKHAPSRAKRIVKAGDILSSAVVGSVDKVGLVSDDEEAALASTGFFQFRSEVYDPKFLLILLKSKLVTQQLQQEATGGILSSVADFNLHHIIIPRIPSPVQVKIASMVEQSHNLFKEAKGLLSQAMEMIDDYIAPKKEVISYEKVKAEKI